MKKIVAAILTACTVFSYAMASEVSGITLSGNGIESKTFGTIQEALDSIGSKEGQYKIELPKGTYSEVLYYNGPADITLSGCTTEKYGADVIIAKDNNGDLLRMNRASNAQKNRCLFEFEGTGNLTVENITFHNTFRRSAAKVANGQAETIGFDSTGNLAAYNCSFKSYQDTLRMTGKSWFYKCYVEGDTDFIWMEETGKVALFEECEIVSLYDEFHTDPTSYIAAPRMACGNSAGKGLVIFNSVIKTQEGETTYLARTPWNSGYYNQVAFINNTLEGVIDYDVWKGKALTANGIPDTVIGWKIDEASVKNLKLEISKEGQKCVLDKKDVKNEFSGRESIINRQYDLTTLKYKKDLETYWDLESFVKAHGWAVSKDKSKSLLGGEKKESRTEYVFDAAANYADLKIEGFAYDAASGQYVGEAGSTISLKLKDKAVVYAVGSSSGVGTISASKQGAGVYNFATGSVAKKTEKAYVVYEKGADVTIKADSKTYIAKLVVETDKKASFVPVKNITVTSEENVIELPGKKSLQFFVALEPARPTNADYEWTVSDPSAASISPEGLLKAANVTEEKEIVVKATSRDTKAAAGEFKLKILKPDPNSFAVTWLNDLEASNSLLGTDDNDELAVSKKAAPSAGNWVYNGSKINSSFAKGGITYTGYSNPIAGKNTVYVDFPFTALDNIEITDIQAAFGNHGTGNVAVLMQAIVGSKKTDLVTDDSRKARSVKKNYDVSFKAKKGENVTVRVILYGLDGNGETTIAKGKAPTIATITISGKRDK